MQRPPLRRPVALAAACLCIALPATSARAAAGGLDPSFGPNGKVVTSGPQTGQDTGNGVAVQTDGKVVVAGAFGTSTATDEMHDVAVIRYLENGARDPNFATSGVFRRDVGGGQDFAYDVAIAPGGEIVIAGTTYDGGDPDVLVMRLTAGGAPDASFGGGDGTVVTSLSALGDRARAVAVQSDGKIVVAGETGASGGAGDLFVARYGTGGGLDGSFSGDGVATMDVLGTGRADVGRDLVLQPDGRPVVVGSANDGRRDLIAVARFTTGGLPDPSFSSDGRRTVSFGSMASAGRGVALTPTGRIVVVGSRDVGTAATMTVTQLRGGGPLDGGFSDDGKRTVSFGAGPEVGYAALVQGDTILAGGYALSPSGTSDFALARMTPAGALDDTFGGGDGRVLTDFSGKNDLCAALALAPGGKIVGTGGTRFGDSLTLEDVATVRWLGA